MPKSPRKSPKCSKMGGARKSPRKSPKKKSSKAKKGGCGCVGGAKHRKK